MTQTLAARRRSATGFTRANKLPGPRVARWLGADKPPGAPPSGWRRAAGFTLLELLVVMAVIIIATALIVPNLNTTDTSAFNAQVRRATAVLTYARRLAIVEGAPRVAAFYALDADNPDSELVAQKAVEKAVATWESDLLTLGFQAEQNQPEEMMEYLAVTFFPQGGSTGGILNFHLNERQAMIRIDPITGRIATAYSGEDFDEAR